MVAMLRSWPLAPDSSAWARTGEALAHPPVGGQLAVGDGGADPQAAVGGVGDLPRGQGADVDEPLGRGDAEPEVVDQVGAAGEEDRGRVAGDVAHGLGDAARAGVGEGLHACTPPACWMAGTIVA